MQRITGRLGPRGEEGCAEALSNGLRGEQGYIEALSKALAETHELYDIVPIHIIKLIARFVPDRAIFWLIGLFCS